MREGTAARPLTAGGRAVEGAASAAPGAAMPRRFRPWCGRALAPGALLVALLAAPPLGAKVLLSQEQALALAFPGCTVERTTLYLTAAQMERAAALAGAPLPGALVHAYAGRCGSRPGGTAYFDTHKVRTLPETIMVVVDAQGRAARVEVLQFREPPDYLPREGWYDQFEGRPLDDELRLRRAVRPVTGATLTARATTEAVRRVLAVDRVRREAAAAASATTGRPPAPAATPRPAARPGGRS